jgi:small subunit ribosomal protein S17
MADETEETTDEVTEPAEAEATTSAPAPAAEAEASPVVAAAAPAAATSSAPPAAEEEGARPNRRKVREGVVVSDAMQSTVVVAVVERVRHPRYGKTVQRTKKLYVHDAEDTAKVGDRVRVQETRPLSKLKRWRLTEVVERAR